MNASKLTQQLDRRMEALDRRNAKASNRQPLPKIDRIGYSEELYYEDARLSVTVFDIREYLTGRYKGIVFDQKGPWVLFKVKEIISGDVNGDIAEGSIILAKWDKTYKVYKKFIYDENPKQGDKELMVIMSFISVTEDELLNS